MARNPRNVVELLRDLIAIPSVNPSGDPGHHLTGEQAIAEYVAAFLKNCGATVQLKPIYPGRPNVLGTFRNSGKPRILFAPHLDTVSVRGMTIKPFDPVIRGGKIYGRGASDTKGPMASMLWAIKTWSETPAAQRSEIEIVFAGLMGEEAGNDGAIALAQSKFKADFAIIGEPTQMKIVHAHKGAAWVTISTSGKSCHGSMPEKGVNAIYAMGKIIERLQSFTIPKLRHQKHSLLGSPTLNVGTIHGGSKVNIVPDRCTLECDLRTIPGFGSREVSRLLTETLKPFGPSVRWKIERSPEPLFTDPKNPWIQKFLPATRGLDTANWFCDAAVFSQVGIPSIAIGPGSIAQAHTADEFIKVSDLEAGTRRFIGWLQSR